MDLSVKEAGGKKAFQYRDSKNKEKIIEVTYNEFQNDTYYLGTALSTLNKLTITDNVIVGNSAFDSCINLTEVVILNL